MAVIYRDETSKYNTSNYALQKTADAPDFITVLSSTLTDIFAPVATVGTSIGNTVSSFVTDLGLGLSSGGQQNVQYVGKEQNNKDIMLAIAFIAMILITILIFRKKR